jgi:hypothetical protein
MRITWRFKINFSINLDYVDEVECEVSPLDACEVIFCSSYLWERDETFYRRENKYLLVKGGMTYIKKIQGEEQHLH